MTMIAITITIIIIIITVTTTTITLVLVLVEQWVATTETTEIASENQHDQRWQKVLEQIKGGSDVDVSLLPIIEWEFHQVVFWLQMCGFNMAAKLLGEYTITGAELRYMKKEHLVWLGDHCKHIQLDETTAKKIVQEMRKLEVKTQFRLTYEHLWRTVLTNVNDTIDVDLARKSYYVKQLVQLLRAPKNLGPFAFWKSDAVFFDKVDNWLASLLVPFELQKLFMHYFTTFLEDENDEDLHSLKFETGDGDWAEQQHLSAMDVQKLSSQLNRKLALKNYFHFYERFDDYMTGKDIVDWVLSNYNKLNFKYSTRRHVVLLCEQLLQRDILIHLNLTNSTVDKEDRKFDDKNTLFYTYCGNDIKAY
ncbi:hypothetical protein RFI_22151 [Reticulomyxa filosa]|uniref:DEP domain-containing protein n=1 Tax=Reticulomyxa filosa TaxID=46433 RepID=X6MMH1_RETFI|nr:hypothetical protein RFI_22151 [Reticulomyxa filosa]|eukprot:ETO15213.1 hypothetical protein RFI_22151 [Reticulomyxa filosa]